MMESYVHFLLKKTARPPRSTRGQPRSTSGQGMVEFALILPLLLLVVFGIFELGRLMVIYSSVQAASREAARYASAAGNASPGLPYYLDVAGITASARRVALLVEPDSVDITWDSGPGTTPRTNVTSASSIRLGDRVNVTVTATFEPMLGLTPIRGFPIISTTSRTIIKEVAVGPGTGGGGPGGPGGGGTPPNVWISLPDGSEVASIDISVGESITLRCNAEDPDGDLTTLTWQEGGTTLATSSSSPLSFNTGSLASGTHVLTCRGVDAEGGEGTDQITVNVNAPPWVVIDSPNSGASYEEGTVLTFTGRAGDDEDGDLSDDIVWFDNGVPFGPGGATFDFSTLAVGFHAITAQVTDSDGATVTSAAVTFAIILRTPPDLIIISPPDDVAYARNTNVVFQGTAIDAKDGNLSHLITWTSSLDGNLGTGAQVSRNNLQTGTHVITARVTDSDGLTDEETITISIVDDDPPVVDILTPASGVHISLNQAISFTGTATDTTDGDLSSQLRWSSSVDGPIGTGASFSYATLTAGIHTITARVTDSDGLTSADQIVIYIEEVPNTPPTVVIDTPLDNASFREGQGVRFAGTATDLPDGDISSLIRWINSLGETIGSGSVITSTFAPGTHVITATVTDSGGLTASDVVSIQVRERVCPSAGNVVIGGNNSWADKVTWYLTIPTGTTQTEPFQMTSLNIDLRTNPSTAAISAITVEGQNIPFNFAGTTFQARDNPVWTGYFPADGTIEVIFSFSPRVRRNRGSLFIMNAAFSGCQALPGQNVTP